MHSIVLAVKHEHTVPSRGGVRAGALLTGAMVEQGRPDQLMFSFHCAHDKMPLDGITTAARSPQNLQIGGLD